MVSIATSFSDTQNHWARLFITALAQRGIVNGLPNGIYRPDNSLTRAEFAAIIAKAFAKVAKKRQYVPFVDVPANYWAAYLLAGFLIKLSVPITELLRRKF
jgi:S-layer homology domain